MRITSSTDAMRPIEKSDSSRMWLEYTPPNDAAILDSSTSSSVAAKLPGA
jgi:hypothetical protein